MIIGITGGIASGKSTISKHIGTTTPYKVIDADYISKSIISRRDVELKLKFLFPEAFNEVGFLNRNILGNIIFNDSQRKNQLDEVMLPLIRAEIDRQVQVLNASGEKIIFIDSPLLIESGMVNTVDKIILITCDKDERINRIVKRNGWDILKAEKAINSQLSDEEKIKYASYVIDTTNKSIEDLKYEINLILKALEGEDMVSEIINKKLEYKKWKEGVDEKERIYRSEISKGIENLDENIFSNMSIEELKSFWELFKYELHSSKLNKLIPMLIEKKKIEINPGFDGAKYYKELNQITFLSKESIIILDTHLKNTAMRNFVSPRVLKTLSDELFLKRDEIFNFLNNLKIIKAFTKMLCTHCGDYSSSIDYDKANFIVNSNLSKSELMSQLEEMEFYWNCDECDTDLYDLESFNIDLSDWYFRMEKKPDLTFDKL